MNLTAIGSAFQVEPELNNIDSLKDAIKLGKSNDFTNNPALIQIHAWKAGGAGGWEEKSIDGPETVLEANTEETPYGVVFPL